MMSAAARISLRTRLRIAAVETVLGHSGDDGDENYC